MRITCPNCGAHYEVADDVIPEIGRDVQCSSCGNTWFQKSPHSSAEQAETVASDTGNDEPEIETREPEPQSETESRPEPDVARDEPINDPVAHAKAQRRGLDSDVADILRQEAERETAERSTEDTGEPSVEDAIKNITNAPVPDETEQVTVDMSDTVTDAASSVLPDIEEINSTLASDSIEDLAGHDADEIANKSGFRRGFIFAVVVFAILALIYVFAHQIADAIPQSAPLLSTYVDWVNALRETVDSLMLKAVDRLTGLLAQMDGSSAN